MYLGTCYFLANIQLVCSEPVIQFVCFGKDLITHKILLISSISHPSLYRSLFYGLEGQSSYDSNTSIVDYIHMLYKGVDPFRSAYGKIFQSHSMKYFVQHPIDDRITGRCRDLC